VARFAEGGPVGRLPRAASASGPNTSGNTYHLHSGDVADPDSFVGRRVIPALDKIQKRGR